jgi:uncharacterized protein (UPF0332 family)
LIRTGFFNPDLCSDLKTAYLLRVAGDYDDDSVTRENAEKALGMARGFVQTMEAHLKALPR